MGKYTIVISGEGPHHNGLDDDTDANTMALGLVGDMKAVGHQITSAIFNYDDNTKTDDLDALTRPGNETLLHGGVAGGGMKESMSGAPPIPNLSIFRFEAKDGDIILDTIYIQGENEEAARQTFKDRGLDDVPEGMLTVTQLNELPAGEELLNPA